MSGHQDLLASVPIFGKLPRKTLDRLDRLMVERSFPAGSEIVKEGDEGAGFFLITSGSADVRHGSEHLASLKAGDYFGEMALLDGHRRSASIDAVETVNCLVLTRWDFVAEVRSNPDLAIELLEGLSMRLRAVEAHQAAQTQA